jgi:hypothetical protein
MHATSPIEYDHREAHVEVIGGKQIEKYPADTVLKSLQKMKMSRNMQSIS